MQLLEVLLCLQINTDAIKSAEEKGNKMERLRKKREAIMKMSKKEKKVKQKLKISMLKLLSDVLNQDVQMYVYARVCFGVRVVWV